MATALDLYFPFDAGAGANLTEDNWREMARFWAASGPIAGEDNGMLPYGDSTGMQCKIKTGRGFVRGHFGKITAEKTLPIAAVGGIPGGQSRQDLIVLRADFVNNRLEVDVVSGAPAATGTQVAPAPTQSAAIWEIGIGEVGPLTNATATITAGLVVDTRALVDGGNSWSSYTPVDSGVTVGNGTRLAKYSRVGKLCRVRWSLILGSTSAIGNPVSIGLPFPAAAGLQVGSAYYLDSGNRHWVGSALIDSALSLVLAGLYHTESTGTGAVGTTGPFSFGSADRIVAGLTYEVA